MTGVDVTACLVIAAVLVVLEIIRAVQGGK